MDEIRLDTKELDRIAAQLGMKREAVCRRFAFELEYDWKEQITINKAIDTGAYRSSVYVETKDNGDFSQNSGEAMSQNPNAEIERHPIPSGKVIANVGPCVGYAGFVELGTSRVAARPAGVPAIEQLSQKYNDGKEWEELVK